MQYRSKSRRVLIISADILPYPNLPTTGAGLRAWSLGQGLLSRGHQVLFSMPAAATPGREMLLPSEAIHLMWQPGRLVEVIQKASPEVVVVCGWSTLNHLRQKVELPIALDQHGPLLLERQFRRVGTRQVNEQEKVMGLSRADFFSCAGHKQRSYFEPWLIKSGFLPDDKNIAVIPVSLSPGMPEHQFSEEITFMYGGVFLPWQDPTIGLETLVSRLDALGKGQLRFFGGKHPFVKMDQGIFKTLQARLQKSSRVKIEPLTPHAQLIEIYRQAHVAIDLMAYNPERTLAFTTRTVEYLWCGLPVIYNDYAELSSYIEAYDAGWTVNPQDRLAITRIIDEILLASPNNMAQKSMNAQKLVRERLNWEQTIEPLAQFVQAPSIRANKPVWSQVTSPAPVKNLSHLLDEARLHYQHGGLKQLVKETIDFAQRRLQR